MALAISLAAAGCAQGEPWTPRPYYDIYDEAVNLYYKSPRRPKAALSLMDRACRFNANGQDLLCYNLGVLRELRGDRPRLALAAYRRASRIRPHAIYTAAVRRLAPETPSAQPKGAYLQTVQRLLNSCQNENRRAALIHLRRFVETQLGSNPDAELNTEDRRRFAQSLGQPYLRECLAGAHGDAAAEEYTALLNKLASDSPGLHPGAPEATDASSASAEPEELDEVIIQERAALDDFASLWDLERRLKGIPSRRALADSDPASQSKQPITRAWDAVHAAAQEGDGATAAERLRDFFTALQKSQPAPGERDPGHARRVLALRRAAAILLRSDPYFARVQNHPEIQQATRRILGPPS